MYYLAFILTDPVFWMKSEQYLPLTLRSPLATTLPCFYSSPPFLLLSCNICPTLSWNCHWQIRQWFPCYSIQPTLFKLLFWPLSSNSTLQRSSFGTPFLGTCDASLLNFSAFLSGNSSSVCFYRSVVWNRLIHPQYTSTPALLRGNVLGPLILFLPWVLCSFPVLSSGFQTSFFCVFTSNFPHHTCPLA